MADLPSRRPLFDAGDQPQHWLGGSRLPAGPHPAACFPVDLDGVEEEEGAIEDDEEEAYEDELEEEAAEVDEDVVEADGSLRLDLFDDGGGSIGYCTAGDDVWESDPYLEEDELPGVEASADIEYDEEEEGVCYDDDLGDLMGLEPSLGLEVYESGEDDGEESVYSVGLYENRELGTDRSDSLGLEYESDGGGGSVEATGLDSECVDDDVEEGELAAMGSDLNSDTYMEAAEYDGTPIRWDSLSLEDPPELEWEVVEGGVGERDVLGMVVEGDDEEIDGGSIVESELHMYGDVEYDGDLSFGDGDDAEETVGSGRGWEFYMAINNLDRNAVEDDSGSYLADQDDYIYTAWDWDGESFGPIDDEGLINGSPPTIQEQN